MWLDQEDLQCEQVSSPTTTRYHHAGEHPQALAFREAVKGARNRDHVTALALATAVSPTLASGLAP